MRVVSIPNPARVAKLLLVAIVLIAAGCRSWAPKTVMQAEIDMPGDCHDQASLFRDVVELAGVVNAQTQHLPQLPVLHVDRFLVALAHDARSVKQQVYWVELLAELGMHTRTGENANLPEPWSGEELQRLTDCAKAFANSPALVAARASLVAAVRETSPVEDAYSDAHRWLGLYALMRPFYKFRIKQLHAKEMAAFGSRRASGTTHVFDLATRRQHLPASTVAQWFSSARAVNPLNLPGLNNSQLQQLFARHAPRLFVDFADTNDAIAAPFWQDGELQFATHQPTVYTKAAFTRVGEQPLLQLNYVFWFSERKPTSFADIYAGKVDGLIWRVTLDQDGEVLLYDSIHNCGCYHKMFRVSDRLQVRQPLLSEEPKTIYDATDLDPELPATLHLESNTHFIIGLDNVDSSHSQGYKLAPYQGLTMLPSGDRVRSMFNASGIVPGSQRLERYTLWPTGVEDVGAMRQWGTHAIGFIDRQHFDDVDLFDRYFLRKQRPSADESTTRFQP